MRGSSAEPGMETWIGSRSSQSARRSASCGSSGMRHVGPRREKSPLPRVLGGVAAARHVLGYECWTLPDSMSNIEYSMSDISPTVLMPVLLALGEQLAYRGSEVHLVVIGGSALLAAGLGDRPTQDVGVVAVVKNGQLVSAAPFPPALEELRCEWRTTSG